MVRVDMQWKLFVLRDYVLRDVSRISVRGVYTGLELEVGACCSGLSFVARVCGCSPCHVVDCTE